MIKTISVSITCSFILSFTSFAFTFTQNSPSNAHYVNLGFNKPSVEFGHSANSSPQSINALGVSLNGGKIIFFGDKTADNRGKLGLDLTFVELALNHHVTSSVMSNVLVSENKLRSLIIAMQAGPVYSYVPAESYIFDIYVQGGVGLSNFTYFDHYTNSRRHVSFMPQLRLTGGLRLGYQFLHLNIEYNWGRPNVKREETTIDTAREFDINQSFIKVGLAFKFSAFK